MATLVLAPRLQVSRAGEGLRVTLVGEPDRLVVLLSAAHLNGPWAAAAQLRLDRNGEAVHPVAEPIVESARFYQAQQL